MDRVVIDWPSGTTAGTVRVRRSTDSSPSPSPRADAMSDATRSIATGAERVGARVAALERASIRAISSRFSSRSVLVAAQLRYHMLGGYDRLVLALGVCTRDRSAALVVRPRQGRQPAERLHQRHQPHAAARSRRAARSGRSRSAAFSRSRRSTSSGIATTISGIRPTSRSARCCSSRRIACRC